MPYERSPMHAVDAQKKGEKNEIKQTNDTLKKSEEVVHNYSSIRVIDVNDGLNP